MKRQSPLLFVLLLVASCAVFISCKKNSNSKNTITSIDTSIQCHITTVESVDIINTKYKNYIVYDGAYRISAIIDSSRHQRSDFIYSGNKIFRTLTVDTGVFEIDTITLNSASLVDSVVMHYLGYTGYFSMNYDANNQLINEDMGFSSIGYIWKDGNPIGTTGSSTDSIKYDFSKKAMDGDYFWLDNLKWGARSIKNSNLVTQFINSSIKYDFDSSGKITSMVILDYSGATSYSYTYTCK